MKMKILLLILVAATSLLYAADVLDSFTANSDGRVITLSWRSSDESQIKAFDIERSGSDQNFTLINTVQAKGYSYNYTYVDESAFMKGSDGNPIPQAKSTYKYRIKIVAKDNSSFYSNTAVVAHNVSGIRRTWGMIKEMFR